MTSKKPAGMGAGVNIGSTLRLSKRRTVSGEMV
jgi:hypothetical protein